MSRKYVVLLGDGMSDWPVAELDGRTPLQAAHTPNMDSIAARGILGMVQTIPENMQPGSDVANLCVLGYDPASIYTGRSPLEAAGMHVELGPDDVAFRCNLVTLGHEGSDGLTTDIVQSGLSGELVMVDFAGGHPDDAEADSILASLQKELAGDGIEFHRGVSYRHLVVWRDGLDMLTVAPPHDLTDQKIREGWPEGEAAVKVLDLMSRAVEVLAEHPVNSARAKAGKKPVNAIWLWGQGKMPRISTFKEKYGLSGAMITAVDLLRGIGISLDFRIIDVPGATGYLDTNYEGKAQGALDALREVDVVYIHVEAPDEAGHGGLLQEKLKAIEDFDSKVVGPVMRGLEQMGNYGVLLQPDHSTPLATKTHSTDPVPFAAVYGDNSGNSRLSYCEKDAGSTGILIDPGHELMGKFIEGRF